MPRWLIKPVLTEFWVRTWKDKALHFYVHTSLCSDLRLPIAPTHITPMSRWKLFRSITSMMRFCFVKSPIYRCFDTIYPADGLSGYQLYLQMILRFHIGHKLQILYFNPPNRDQTHSAVWSKWLCVLTVYEYVFQ